MAKRLRSFWKRKWPKPYVKSDFEPNFYFLLTPPNSGSTAIADFMGQLEWLCGLQERYEGQWLIDGMCAADRWAPDKKIDYRSVRAVWLSVFERLRHTNPQITGVIEKSPPHLVRHRALNKIFPAARFVVNNRNPYANISSRAFRYGKGKLDTEADRMEFVQELAQSWVRESRILKDAVQRYNYPILSYESFCEKPSRIFSCFGMDVAKESISESHRVAVKDYDTQVIQNMNESQIKKLNALDVSTINEVLQQHIEIVEFFGYQVISIPDT